MITGLWVAQIMNNRGGYHLVSNNCQDFVNFLFNEIDEEQHPPALSSIGLHRPRKEKHKDLFSIRPLGEASRCAVHYMTK